MQDEYSGPTIDTPTEKLGFYSDLMRHKVALYKHRTLTYYTQGRVKGVLKISGLIHTEPKHSPWTER